MIGAALPRIDARAQVSGSARFGVDIRLPGMLQGGILRSPLAHARLLHVDASRARKAPGVHAVLSAADVPAQRHGRLLEDMEVLARRKVLFRGDRVAAVAAGDADAVAEALALIEVEYEELPAVFDPLDAMSPGAPILHDELATYGGLLHPSALPNVCSREVVTKGNTEEGFAQAAHLFEHTFTTPMVHHGHVEPHASVAQLDPSGWLTVWTSTQSPHFIREALAKVLGWPLARLRVIGAYCGGGFGAKGYLMDEALCALLSERSGGRPVRLVMSREEEFEAACPRNASRIVLKTGMRGDGTMTARQATVIFDTGANAGQKPSALPLGWRRALGPYNIPHARIEAFCVYTNKIPGGQCRAPGDPQVTFAGESQLDIIAHELRLDPLELRLRNAPRDGEANAVGVTWKNVGFSALLRESAAAFAWKEPPQAPPGKRRGVGMACSERSTAPGSAGALVTLNHDGSANLLTGAVDVGTGTDTILAQIVAHELGLAITDVTVSSRDTAHTPYDSGSGGSRETHVAGNAVLRAARDVRAQLVTLAAQLLEAAAEDLRLSGGRLSVAEAPDRGISIRELAAAALRKLGGPILGRGSFVAGAPAGPVFAAHFAEVEVDEETGQIAVLRYLAAHDLGKTLNPATASSQIEGGVAQGIGFALAEEMCLRDGVVLNPNFLDYKIPMALDLPRIEARLVEGYPGAGPYGAKSIGEPPVVPVAAAIANALFDATGLRMTSLPLSPERVREGLRRRMSGS